MRLLAAAMVAALTMSCSAFGSGASEEDSFSYDGIEAVYVRAEFLNVEVSGDDAPSVSMSSEPGTGYRVLHEAEGSRLRIWLEKDWPFGGSGDGTISLQCPRDVRLKLETVSGHIRVEGMEGVHCTVSTISGGIVLRENHGTLSAASVSGKISLDADTGRVIAKTVSGGIDGRGLLLSEESSFSTVSGDVDVRLDSDLDDLRFDLRSLSGRIVVGTVRAERGLRMGTGGALVRGQSVSGALIFR